MQYICNAFNKKFFTKCKIIARIAQLVEHDLAKVGVAGSSPVSRSFFILRRPGCWNGRHVGLKIQWPIFGCGGSSPPPGTKL